MESDEEWSLQVTETDDYVFEVTLENKQGILYRDAKYVIDMSSETNVMRAQAFGYFKKDWDLKLEAIELIKLFIQEYK